MRWPAISLSERGAVALAWALSPLWVAKDRRERVRQAQAAVEPEWQPWFAWRPVAIGHEIAWCERVERLRTARGVAYRVRS